MKQSDFSPTLSCKIPLKSPGHLNTTTTPDAYAGSHHVGGSAVMSSAFNAVSMHNMLKLQLQDTVKDLAGLTCFVLQFY